MTDSELLKSYQLSQAEADFAELVRRHTNLVYSVCQRVLGEAHAAEDATQATFLVLLQKIKTLPAETLLSGWLYRTAELTARDAKRTKMRISRRENKFRESSPAQESSATEWQRLQPEVDAAMAGLPDAQRDVLVMRYMEGLSREEIASRLGCPEATIHSRLSRGLEALRGKLSPRAATLSVAALSTLLAQNALIQAPQQLAGTVIAACQGKAAVAATAAAAGLTLKAKVLLVATAVTAVSASTVAITSVSRSSDAAAPGKADGQPSPAASTKQERIELQFDFEDGLLPALWIAGIIAKGPQRDQENKFALQGAPFQFNETQGPCGTRLWLAGKLQYHPETRVEFDFWLNADAQRLGVQTFNQRQAQNYYCFLSGTRGSWQHSSIKLKDLLPSVEADKKQQIGDSLEDLWISADGEKAELYIDNIRVWVEAPEDAAADF